MPSPPSRLSRLPIPLSHFLGYRNPSTTSVKPLHPLTSATCSLLSCFVGMLAVSGFFMAPFIQERSGGLVVVGSIGAAAILLLSTLESPFSQPRNAFFSQIIGALVGVSVAKLFLLMPSHPAEATLSSLPQYPYIAGALAVGITAFIMVLTRTTHPPAGATALLAATEPGCVRLGWVYVGVVVAGTCVLLAVACLLGNLGRGRRYPVYWWSPGEVSSPVKEEQDVESDGGGGGGESNKGEDVQGICVSAARGIVVPQDMHVSEEEMDVLRVLEERIRQRTSDGLERVETAGAYSSTSTLRNEDGRDSGRDK